MTGDVHIGTMGWSYDFWEGDFYPKGTVGENRLAEYSKHFGTVEVDNTFYRIPRAGTVRRWEQLTPPGFLFALKFPRVITHIKMLADCADEARAFIRVVSQLGSKLGPSLIQLPPEFGLKHIPRLREFLPSLPSSKRFALEVRNRELLSKELYDLLRENGVALVFVDSPSMPPSEEITSDFAYVRWEGDRRRVNGKRGKVEVDRTRDIEKWAERLRELMNLVPDVFGFFSKYYSGYPPDDAERLLGYLRPR